MGTQRPERQQAAVGAVGEAPPATAFSVIIHSQMNTGVIYFIGNERHEARSAGASASVQ